VLELFRDMAGALELLTVYLGERLGLYRALHAGGPATSAELAARTGTTERHIREWLEHHAAAGLLEVDDPGVSGRYDLVTIFEGLHDMSRPVDALRVARGMLREPGCVIVADELVEDEFTAPRFDRGAISLRLERGRLPAGGHERPGDRRDRSRDATRHAAPVRLGSRLRRPGSPSGQGGTAALLPADTMTSRRAKSPGTGAPRRLHQASTR
jgi:hypothetical protein